MVRDREKQQKALRRANMTEEERKIQQEKDKERKRIKANSIKEEMKLDDRRSKNRLSKANMRASRSEEQVEFDKLEYLLSKRKARASHSEVEKDVEREKSKVAMRDFLKEGRIRDFQKRQVRNLNDLALWTIFWKKGEKFQDLIRQKKPDIASLIIEAEDLNEDPLSNVNMNTHENQLNEWYNDEMEKDFQSAEEEKSEYEKARDENIRELEAAKKASGLFSD